MLPGHVALTALVRLNYKLGLHSGVAVPIFTHEGE